MDPPTRRHSLHSLWTVYGSSPNKSPLAIPRLSTVHPIIDYPRKFNFKQQTKIKSRQVSPLRKWCRITGWHGILDCYEADNVVVRAFWFGIIALTGFFGSNQIFSMLHDFLSEEQWVTNMHFTDAGPQGLPMPNLTLCNLNTFNQSYLDWLRIEPSALMLAKSQSFYSFYQRYLSAESILPNTIEYNRSIAQDLTNISRLWKRFPKAGAEGVKPFFKNASHSCRASVLACGSTSDPTMEKGAACCEKNYYEASDNCMHLRFSETNGEPLSIFTETSGVYLLLHPRLNDYNSIFMPHQMPAAGFSISLSLQENVGSIQLLLSPGTHNTIWMTLERRRTTSRKLMNAIQYLYHLTPPCTEGPAYKVLDEAHYNPELCRADCDLWMSLKLCNCVQANGQAIKKPYNVCNAEQSVACGMEKANDSNVLKKCLSSCAEPCKYGRIKLLHNAVAFPAANKAISLQRYVSRIAGANFSSDDVRQLISVKLVYESMYVRMIEKFNRVSLDELISNIGGAMGVWTGISLISIVQLLAYLWYCASKCMRKRNRR